MWQKQKTEDDRSMVLRAADDDDDDDSTREDGGRPRGRARPRRRNASLKVFAGLGGV